VVADFDGDGDLDVFEADITHWWAGPSSDKSSLLVNGGRAKDWKFTREERGIVRAHADARWNQGDLYAGWLDVGNDGLLDLFIASGDYPDEQRLRIWRQKEDHSFQESTSALGVDWANCTQPTVADFNRDGMQDLFLGNSNMRATADQAKARVLRPALFAQANGGHWLRLTLRGGGKGHANPSAIGARVTVKAGGLVAVREVSGARGHAGHHDETALTIGLGTHEKIDEVRVRWPDSKGTVEWFSPVTVDHAWRLVEGGGAPEPDDRER
jgi:ASPIC and UnbV/FG-GAP-like repeat